MVNINVGGSPAYQPTVQPQQRPAAQSVATNEGGQRNTVGFPQGVADSRGVSGGDGVRRLIAGQPIPPDYEVLLTPQDQKKLYEQGYLDVQKKFSVMESNEGAFSLLGKSLACVFGPSKSIGAIKIDPMFMEMIKDPNAKVGFGYTRVRNESLQVLPSPEIPPRPETPAPPPPVLTPQTPQPHTRPERPPAEETPWNPVTMAREQTLYSLSMSARWRGVGNKSGQQMGEHKTNVQDSTLSASFQEMLGWSGPGLKPSQHAVINAHMVKLFTGDMAQQNSYDQAAYILNDTALSTRTQWEGQRVDTTHRTKNGNTEVNQRSSNHQYHFFVDQHRSIPLTGSDLTQYAQLTGKSEAELSTQTPKPNMYDLYIATNKSMNLGETPTTSDAGTNQGRLQNTYSQLYQKVTGQSVPAGFDFKKVSMEDVYALRILSDGMSKTNGKISPEQARSAITLNGDGSLEIKDDPATRNMLKGLIGAPRGQNPSSSELIASYRLNLESNFAREGGRTFQFTQNDTDSVMTALRPNLERDGLTSAQITEAHITEEDAAGLSISSMDKDNQMEGIGRRNTFNANGTMVRADLIHGTEAASLPKQELPTGAQYNAINANMTRLEGFTQMNHMSTSYDRSAVRNTIKTIEGQIKTLSDAGDPNVQKYQTELNRLRGLDNAMRGQYVEKGGPGGAPSQDAVVANITTNLENLARPGISDANIARAESYIRPLVQSLGENAAPPGNKITLNGTEYSGTWAQILDQVKTTAAQDVGGAGTDGATPVTGGTTPVTGGSETPIGAPVTTGGNATTGVTSNTPVTNGNTTVNGTNPATAGQTFYKADEVIASVENDLAVLKDLKTKIDSGVQVNPQSVANFVNSINEKLKILSTPGATDLPVGADGKVVLPAKVTQLTAEYDALNKGVISDYTSKANAAAATKASNSGNYEADVNNSLKEFRQHLNTYMKDKSLSVEEGAHLQRFIDETSVNLGNHARSLGIDMAGLIDDRGQAVGRPQDIMSRLSGLDDATIKSSYKAKTGQDMPDNQLQELKRTFDSVQSVQANVNLLNGEIRDVIALNNNIKTLNQRLDEFESLGVAKTAFQGEMKDLAQKQSGVFASMMQHAYGFQTPPTLTSEGKLDRAATENAGYVQLMDMALNGGLPVPPNVGFVDRAQLGGANAAYVPKEGDQTQPMILIASDLADPSKSHQLKEAFAEEMFHHLERSQGVQELAVADAKKFLGRLGMDPNEQPEDLSELPQTVQKAYNDLSAARAGDWDATGDEGRAALFALRQVQSGNVSVNNGRIDTNRLAAEATRGRNERANVSASAIDQTGVAADQGKANADIRDSQGNVVVRAGARMEFSSSPAPGSDQAATAQDTETSTTQATTAAAPTGYADKAQYQELFNDLAKEYKPKLAALDTKNAPAEEYQRLLGQMQSQFSGNSQMPIALDWQRGEIFGSLPSSRVGPQSQATFTTAAGRQNDDPRQPDHNFNYGSDVDAPPINPHASRSVPMQELYNRGNFGETNGANQFQQTNQTVSQNFAPPEPEGFVNKFVDTLSNVGKGTLKSLPDIGSGLETAGKVLANFADQWRKQIQELWFGPNGVCANLSAYSLTAHNVIYGEGGGPGNDRDKLMEGGTEHMFNKVTSQTGAPNYDRVRQELAEKDKQYRKDMDLRRTAQEMAGNSKSPTGLGFK